MKRRTFFIGIVCLALAGVTWALVLHIRGPVMPGYQITEQALVQTVVATGRVTAVSRAQVGSPVTGVVIERRVREGDVVQPGDVLAILRADDLEAAVLEAQAELDQLQQSTRPQAQAALREAEVRLAQASREARRRRDLFRRQAISREELERANEAEASAAAALEQARLTARSLVVGHPNEAVARARLASAQALLAKTTIRSEVAGTVLTRNAEPGDLVQPNKVLFEIARSGDTEVLVPLDEKNLEVLAIGQQALCVADSYPARPFPATVSFIAPSIDAQRGTIDVRLAVKPEPDFLRQDMTVSVNIETGRRDRAIVVPNDALTSIQGKQARVWMVIDGRAVRRPVQLGLRGLTQTEVTRGLKAGDWVLANGDAAMSEGYRVRVRADAQWQSRSGVESATRSETPLNLD